jgi:high-affinity Fe2+/Pb2+ permease
MHFAPKIVSRHRMSRSGTTTIFTLGFVAWAAGANAVAVYGFDLYEPMWGRGPSFQLGLWIIMVAAILVAIGFSLGTKRTTAPLPWWKPFSFSGAFTVVFGAFTFLASYLGRLGLEQDSRLLFLGLLTFALSFGAAKLLARHSSSVNKLYSSA